MNLPKTILGTILILMLAALFLLFVIFLFAVNIWAGVGAAIIIGLVLWAGLTSNKRKKPTPAP